MESNERISFAKYSQVTMNAVNLRLRDRVPFVDRGSERSVVDVLHRVTSVDLITNRRFKQTAELLIKLADGHLSRNQALNLLAVALGYSRFHGVQKAMVDLRIMNIRKQRRLAARKAKEAVCEQ